MSKPSGPLSWPQDEEDAVPHDHSQPLSRLRPGEDYTDFFTEEDIERGRRVSTIGYLGFLFLVPSLLQPENPYARFHAGQSVLLVGVGAVLTAIVWVLVTINPFFLSLYFLLTLSLLLMMGLAMADAWQGRARALPLIGRWAIFH